MRLVLPLSAKASYVQHERKSSPQQEEETVLGQMTAQMISLSKLEGKSVACGLQDHVAGGDGNFNWPISSQSLSGLQLEAGTQWER